MNNNKMITFFSPTEGFCGSENTLAPDFVFPAKRVIQRNQVILSEPWGFFLTMHGKTAPWC